ncbi:hypothetical protein DPEC_G00102390 [Dallia pectoralis]|uniref:Uncharacterized protein n=1 Tax=Dallia pectoralis TaxID=75939 RepID=A0ACC2GXH2_DALPE|nr:hypothetical protein DPEC_G00102390 [Dallia pectoralis]
MTAHNDFKDETSNVVPWTLFVILVIVIALLVYLYKRLNRETNGQYTIHKLIYGEGGARDWLRDRVRALEVWSGRRIRLLSDNDEAAGEEEADQVEDVERGSDRGVSQEGDNDDEEGMEDDLSDDYSSLEGCDLRERAKLTEVNKKMEMVEKNSHDDGEREEGAVGGQESGRGLLVDLHPFSGSAIWSGNKEEGDVNAEDVTAL